MEYVCDENENQILLYESMLETTNNDSIISNYSVIIDISYYSDIKLFCPSHSHCLDTWVIRTNE